MPDTPILPAGERLVLLARTSTEDQQDPAASLAWQRARAEQCIAGHGSIVRVIHDIDVSRSVPWRRRPGAAALLVEMADPRRDFDGIVVGELPRAFGAIEHAAMTLPRLEHYRVSFWSPEFGGRFDPASEASDVVLAAFCGMSKGERRRIQMRVSTAMGEQALDGRFLGGRPPYGYRLVDTDVPHPNPAKRRDGRMLRRLEPDPVTAPVVARIFDAYTRQRLGHGAIATLLNAEGVQNPSAHDPERNPHRQGRQWDSSTVRAILLNPKYTGHLVWRRTRGAEVLIHPDDVAWGYEKQYTWTGADEWRWSTERTHEPLITDVVWAAARQEASQGKSRRPVIRQTDVRRTYVLRGMVRCALCGRLMEGDALRDKARYRCRLSGNRAIDPVLAEGHPKHVSIREDKIVPVLDGWLAGVFDRSAIDDTVAALAPVALDPLAEHRAQRAREVMSDCDERLGRYRKLLDTGGVEADVVGPWIADVRAKRAGAERDLVLATEHEPVTTDSLRALITAMGSIRRRLRTADPELKQALYRELGVAVTSRQERRISRPRCCPPRWPRLRTRR